MAMKVASLFLGLCSVLYGAIDLSSANTLGDYYQRNLKLDEARKVWNQLLQSDTPSGTVVVRTAKLILYQEGRPPALQFIRAVQQQKKLTPLDEILVSQCEKEINRVFVTDDGQAL